MKRTPEQIKEFIVINHMYYTVADMVAELGLNTSVVKRYYDVLGITPLSAGQQLVDFIKEHPDMTVAEIAIKMQYSIAHVSNIVKNHSLNVKAEPKEPVTSDVVLQQSLNELRKKLSGPDGTSYYSSGSKGFKDKYNQSGSPYGIADTVINPNRTI